MAFLFVCLIFSLFYSAELKTIDYNSKLKLYKSQGEHLYSKFYGFYLVLIKGKNLHGGVKLKREKDMAMV